jgi:hypothetical protein
MVAYIGQYFIFDTHGEDSDYDKYSGQKVKVLRALTESEADLMDTGMMYEVQLPDGQVIDAFEDELEPIQGITASSYVSAAVARGKYSLYEAWHYDRIEPVVFIYESDDSETYEGYLLTGDCVPDEFQVDLTGHMCFNTDFLVLTRTDLPTVEVSSLRMVLDWLDANGIYYRTDEYGLIVGGGEDGRVLDDLSFSWIEDLMENNSI